MTCILPPLSPLYRSLFTPSNLQVLIGDGHGSSRLDAQPNYPYICQTPLPVYHFSSYFTSENLYRRRRKFLNSKLYLSVVVMERCQWCQNVRISISLLVTQPCLHFLHMPPCSCLHLGKFFCCFCTLSFKMDCSKLTSPLIYISV